MTACPGRQAGPASGHSEFILQRFGSRPVRFAGRVIACSDDVAEPAWSRLRLAIYARDGGGYVSEILCQPAAVPQAPQTGPAWCQAALAGSLAAALDQFENAIATASDLAPADAACPAYGDTAFALFEAAGRLCREAGQKRALRHAIGNFLYSLCIEMTAAGSGRPA